MESSQKRNRNVLTIETKLEIINRLENGEIGSTLANKFNVGKATISNIKSNKDSILKFASMFNNQDVRKRRKTMKKPKDGKLEGAIYLWFLQKRCNGEPISGPLLSQKALELNIKLGGSSDFKASTGWLKNFRSRHGIQELDIQEESLSSDAPTPQKFVKMFSDFLEKEGYSLDDIYNADETGLCWKDLPCKSLGAPVTTASDFKLSKERVTIMVCANATGTHPLPLLLIGKLKKPPCFKNVSYLPLCYKSQGKAWITTEIFFDWYTNHFIPNVKSFREKENKTGKVLLILDKAPSHLEAGKLNAVDKNFKVIFLPHNVTTWLQPMEQGVIDELKKNYKKHILDGLVMAEDEEDVTALNKKINLKDCCYMIADSWHNISKDNLKNAWNKLLGNKRYDDENYDDLSEIADMFQVIPGFFKYDTYDALLWLQNDNDPDFPFLTEDEIVSFVQEEEEPSTDDEDGEYEGNRKRKPSHEEAFAALETAMCWYEQQAESCPAQLLLLKRIRDLAAKKCSNEN